MRLVAMILALAACTEGERAFDGQCPIGEDCSPDTPAGLHFLGAGLAGALSIPPETTAVGGTQEIELATKLGETFVPLALPYLADDDGGAALTVAGTEGPIVTLRGVAPGENYLRILDPDDHTLMDRKRFEAAAITGVAIVPERIESTRRALAFRAGTLRFGIALAGEAPDDPERSIRLVDESMTLELAGATRVAWDVLEVDAAPGTLSVTATAGDHPATTLEVEVVAGVDDLLAVPPAQPLFEDQLGVVCFDAIAGERYVAGLAWDFTVDNGPVGTLFAGNCAIVTPERGGTIAITARAGDLERTAIFDVFVAQIAPTPPTPRRSGTTAGERAPRL